MPIHQEPTAVDSPTSPTIWNKKHPWYFVSTNFLIDLLESRGYDLINMIVDQGLSKGIIITLCKKTIMAKETMTLFQDNVFKWYSLPTKVVFNRDP